MTKQSKLAVVLIILVCIIMLAACNPTSTNNDSMFIRCEGYPSSKSYYVVYHKDTKVMYAVSTGKHNHGNFTLLINSDGTPMLWEG